VGGFAGGWSLAWSWEAGSWSWSLESGSGRPGRDASDRGGMQDEGAWRQAAEEGCEGRAEIEAECFTIPPLWSKFPLGKRDC
jgi:hypothetical protein